MKSTVQKTACQNLYIPSNRIDLQRNQVGTDGHESGRDGRARPRPTYLRRGSHVGGRRGERGQRRRRGVVGGSRGRHALVSAPARPSCRRLAARGRVSSAAFTARGCTAPPTPTPAWKREGEVSRHSPGPEGARSGGGRRGRRRGRRGSRGGAGEEAVGGTRVKMLERRMRVRATLIKTTLSIGNNNNNNKNKGKRHNENR